MCTVDSTHARIDALLKLQPGDSIVYHVGLLARDRHANFCTGAELATLSTGWPASSWRRPHAAACCSTSGGSATAPSNTTVTGRRTLMLKTIDPERPTMTPPYLTQVELAARWRISPRTLERWRWAGEGLPFTKVGGRVLYSLSDIEAYEAAQTRCVTGDGLVTAPEPVAPQRRTLLAKAVAWALGENERPNGRSIRP
jgi:hypothetical protein